MVRVGVAKLIIDFKHLAPLPLTPSHQGRGSLKVLDYEWFLGDTILVRIQKNYLNIRAHPGVRSG
jgi:hypothetical protein